jgi:hypothetical protein
MQDSLIERYVYDVVRHLPQVQREDIKKELISLIDDMMPENNNDVEAVLYKLGKPSLLADKYKDKKRYLIGPELYDSYIDVLKLVTPIVIMSLLIAQIISFIISPKGVIDIISEVFSSIIIGFFNCFGFLTIGFAIAERASLNNKIKPDEKWNVKDLPQIPDKNLVIKKSDPITSIIFSIIFIVIFNLVPQIFSIYSFNNGLKIVPIMNMSNYSDFRLYLNIAFIIMVINDFVKILINRINLKLSIITFLLGLASTIIFVIVFNSNQFWNYNFLNELIALSGWRCASWATPPRAAWRSPWSSPRWPARRCSPPTRS